MVSQELATKNSEITKFCKLLDLISKPLKFALLHNTKVLLPVNNSSTTFVSFSNIHKCKNNWKIDCFVFV